MLRKIDGTINYPFFRIYSEAIVEWLKQFDPLNRRLSDPQSLRVIYGNPERIFSNQNIIPDNERIDIPVIGVYLTAIAPDATYNIPQHIRFSREYRLPNNKIHDLYSYDFSKNKTYKINYAVDILSEFKSDADYINFSILREFSNNEIRYLQVISPIGMQWIPIKLSSTRETSSLEPGNAKDLQIRWQLDLEIPNAYLPVTATSGLRWENVVDQFNIAVEDERDFGISKETVNAPQTV